MVNVIAFISFQNDHIKLQPQYIYLNYLTFFFKCSNLRSYSIQFSIKILLLYKSYNYFYELFIQIVFFSVNDKIYLYSSKILQNLYCILQDML